MIEEEEKRRVEDWKERERKKRRNERVHVGMYTYRHY